MAAGGGTTEFVMPMDLKTFKARFGKQAIDEETPKARCDRLKLAMKKKLDAGLRRGDPEAKKADTELKKLEAAQRWDEAADLLDELAARVAVDDAKARKLRGDLAAAMKRAQDKNRKMLPPAIDAARDLVEASVVVDDYVEAQVRLDGLNAIVDGYVDRCAKAEQSLAEATALWNKVLARKQAGELDSPLQAPDFDAMGSAISVKLPLAVDELDTGGIDAHLVDIRQRAASLLTPLPDGAAQKAYTDRHEASKAKLKTWEDIAALGDARLVPVKGEFDRFTTTLGEARAAAGKGDYDTAVTKLDAVLADVAALQKAATQRFDALAAAAPFFNKLLSTSGKPPPDLTTGLNAAALYGLATRARGELKQGKYIAAYDLVDLYEAERKNPSPVVTVAKKVSPKAAEYQKLIKDRDRAALTAALTKSDADRPGFCDQPGATDLLDAMIEEIGPKANSDEKRKLVRAAMMTRYGLDDVTGGADGKGLSTKALPRLYKLLHDLPPEHTTDNDNLKTIERQKAHDTSHHQNTKVVLKAGKTDKAGGTFDTTTLHEVGHGVDAKFSFMNTNGMARPYGGWRSEPFDNVVKVAGEGLGFYDHFEKKGVKRGLLEKFLRLAFAGSDPKSLLGQFKSANHPTDNPAAELKKHPAVVHAFAEVGKAADDDAKRDLSFAARKLIKDRDASRKAMVQAIVDAICFSKKTVDDAIKAQLDALKSTDAMPADAVWAEMAVHPAIDMAVNARLKSGSTGLWDQGDAGAKRCAVDGRVYQEAYSNNWVSYYLSARNIKVTDYQFRAPPEWFAECYARFFLGKLDTTHPLALWLAPQVKAVPTAKA